jgi:parallel beta-helix repeat protein
MATVSGFEAGVVIDGGSANTVQNLIVRDNVGLDDAFNAELGDGIVVFDSPSNLIIGNTVVGNGIFDGIGVLGQTSDNNTIRGNTVEDTIGSSDGGPAGQGIIVNGAEGIDPTVITGTRTEGNTVRRSASGGIANVNNTKARITGNIVEDNGQTNVAGNGIGVQAGFGFGGPGIVTRVLIQDNEVHGNFEHGIQIRRGARENRIIDNNAADNALNPDKIFTRSFDLTDLNDHCDSNVWQGNVWGSGFYNPPCVTTGGSGPPLAPTPEGPLFNNQTCGDQIDNDQDGLFDLSDPDCDVEGPFGDPSCSDGIDNDGGGTVDGEDTNCFPPTEGSPGDRTCSDGIDNDGDTRTDGDDPDCMEGEGLPGSRECQDGRDNDGDRLIDRDDPDCQGEGLPGSRECNDGVDNDGDRLIDGRDPDCQEPGEGLPFSFECSDGVDNDEDGLIDGADPDCQPPLQPEEGLLCQDGFDNDRDGLTDRDDPDCEGQFEGPFGDPSCSDGIDNDRNGAADGDDPNCFQPVEGVPGDPRCLDGIDNDEDGLIDGDDPDCQEPIQP